MHRTLLAALAVGLALSAIACAPRRHYYYDDDGRYGDRWDRDDRYEDRDWRGRVDLNRASARELDQLPGVSEKDARRIIGNRPYDSKEDLVDRRILGPRQYERIEDYVYAGRMRGRNDDDRRDRRDDDHHRPYSRDDNRYQERRFYDDR